MFEEIRCQYCGVRLDEDEEFEHRTCIACMYGGDQGEDVSIGGLFAGVEISSSDIDQNRKELLEMLDEKWE